MGRTLFTDDQDRLTFLDLLENNRELTRIRVLAYSLIGSHGRGPLVLIMINCSRVEPGPGANRNIRILLRLVDKPCDDQKVRF